ncbi:transporter [Lithospermum erythrorhizon]|uniref:Transporter n=1 Tax=Lithospermum erythrorhizon TaxID=34254 RepID=A0AAV3Q789_LITER
MNGKKGRLEIDIPSIVTKMKQPKNEEDNTSTTTEDKSSLREWILSVWEFAFEDVNRIFFSLKVGLAVLLVSLLILIRASYQLFGTDIVWSILTVAVMFEYTVGATFNRGFNRALGSLFAGVLAIVIAQLALTTGRIAEPIIIAISIFVVGTITSFMKLWPTLVPYEYGFRVVLFTYCLIIVSGYRMGDPLRAAFDRLYSIAIGAIIAVFVNLLVFPVWAGEQLHNELVTNFNSVADILEECVDKYLEEDGSDLSEFSYNLMDSFQDEPAYQKCRTTLNFNRLESLANSAKWEPPHGKFKSFFYPWTEYVKVGAVLRYCAYEVMAIHGVLHSEIQAPHFLRIMFQKEIQEASKQAAELVRFLGEDIANMQRSPKTDLLNQVHTSSERLQRAIYTHFYLVTSQYEHNVNNFTNQQNGLLLSPVLRDIDLKLLVPNSDPPSEHTELGISKPARSYHETMRKQSRKIHSWPSREVDAMNSKEGGYCGDYIPKMRTLEGTTALSLATFTSLLIEFVARLDHLVEAVDELSVLAKFKEL